MCRGEFGDLEIGPHVLANHPSEAEGLELWPDGGIVAKVFCDDFDDDEPWDEELGS